MQDKCEVNMSRHIDADKFIEWLDVGHLRSPIEKCFSEYDVKAMIDMQPTVLKWHTFKRNEDGAFIDAPEDGQDILVTFNPSFEFVENESYVCSVTFWENVGDGGYLESFIDCIEITEDMAWMPLPEPYKGDKHPTADVAPVVHGRWIHDNNNLYGCSECLERETMPPKKLKKYCPHCGAKMDGKETE